MKALELIIYPKLERPMAGAEIMPYREQWQREAALKQPKHLNYAELAGEYWHSLRPGEPCSDERWAAIADGDLEPIPRILERFANLPHYDEDHCHE